MHNPTKLLLLAIAIALLVTLLVTAIQDKNFDVVWQKQVLDRGYEVVRF